MCGWGLVGERLKRKGYMYTYGWYTSLYQFPPCPREFHFQVRTSIPGRNLSLGHGNMGVLCLLRAYKEDTNGNKQRDAMTHSHTAESRCLRTATTLFWKCFAYKVPATFWWNRREWDPFSASLPGVYQHNEWGGPSVHNKPWLDLVPKFNLVPRIIRKIIGK